MSKIEAFTRSISSGLDLLGKGMQRNWYESVVFPRYTSRSVALVEDGTPKEIRDRAGLTKLSIPFQVDGKWFPALKDERLVAEHYKVYGENLPRMYFLFDEGRKDLKGDEVAKMQPDGSLKQYFTSGDSIYWWLYMPGTYDLGTLGTSIDGSPVRKTQADLTAADVVQFFSNAVRTKSRGKVTVADAHVYDALGYLYQTKPDLAERWQLLKERLQLTTFVTKYPEAVSTVIHAMAPISRGSFGQFVEDMRRGKYTTWADINSRLDELANQGETLQVGEGSVMSALLYQGLLTGPNDRALDTAATFPPSVVLSFAGLTYINAVMRGYEGVIRSKIEALAALTISEQEHALHFVELYKQKRIEAWQEAHKALGEGLKNLKPRIRSKVLQNMIALEGQMEDLIDHAVTGNLPAELPELHEENGSVRNGLALPNFQTRDEEIKSRK